MTPIPDLFSKSRDSGLKSLITVVQSIVQPYRFSNFEHQIDAPRSRTYTELENRLQLEYVSTIINMVDGLTR